ncbi:MAG: hypothetical protein SVV80_00790 [Planctomycetota bacterium]|nr:hypothetical protein [Planctomycetota bacterium]
MNCTWFFSYALFLIMAVVVGLLVFLLVVAPMRRLLGANSRLKQARPFFVMTLLVILILGAIAPVIGEGLDLPEDSAFMEYVWCAAGNLDDTVLSVALFLFGYVIVMTVLTAALGRYRDE